MESMEAEGDTIDEAIENALRLLETTRDLVTVDILADAKKGVFGIGGRKARVRVSLRGAQAAGDRRDQPDRVREEEWPEEKVAAVRERATEILGEIVRLMGIQATIEAKPGDTPEEILLEIHGDNGGLLIGRRGQTLEALQYVLSRAVCERHGIEGLQLVVDTENYRERRKKTLEDMALRMGEKAKRKRTTVSVDALSARDRRIIHLTLEDDPWVTTRSVGKGAYRRLLIVPEGDRKIRDQEEKAGPGNKPPKG